SANSSFEELILIHFLLVRAWIRMVVPVLNSWNSSHQPIRSALVWIVPAGGPPLVASSPVTHLPLVEKATTDQAVMHQLRPSLVRCWVRSFPYESMTQSTRGLRLWGYEGPSW